MYFWDPSTSACLLKTAESLRYVSLAGERIKAPTWLLAALGQSLPSTNPEHSCSIGYLPQPPQVLLFQLQSPCQQFLLSTPKHTLISGYKLQRTYMGIVQR